MKRKINIQVADPAGNITIFVRDRFPREQYQAIATQLLEHEELKGEQVSFVEDEDSMCMCGMEFCGNASRAFALMKAMDSGIDGFAHVSVNVSGMSEPAEADVDTSSNYARIRMPRPLSVTPYTDTEILEAEGGILVDLDGIVHLVLHDVPGSEELFERIRAEYYQKENPPAFGVMFVDSYDLRTTPYVFVRDVNSTYLEGSCGSGSTAVVIAHTDKYDDGEYTEDVLQPAGTLTTTVIKRNNRISQVFIESTVDISPVMEVEVEV